VRAYWNEQNTINRTDCITHLWLLRRWIIQPYNQTITFTFTITLSLYNIFILYFLFFLFIILLFLLVFFFICIRTVGLFFFLLNLNRLFVILLLLLLNLLQFILCIFSLLNSQSILWLTFRSFFLLTLYSTSYLWCCRWRIFIFLFLFKN